MQLTNFKPFYEKKTEHICNTFDPDNVEPEMWNKMAAQIEKNNINIIIKIQISNLMTMMWISYLITKIQIIYNNLMAMMLSQIELDTNP